MGSRGAGGPPGKNGDDVRDLLTTISSLLTTNNMFSLMFSHLTFIFLCYILLCCLVLFYICLCIYKVLSYSSMSLSCHSDFLLLEITLFGWLINSVINKSSQP